MAAMVNFFGLTADQSASIQGWVRAQLEEQLEARLTMAGRAIEFMNNIDTNQKEVIDKIKLEASRVDESVINVNKIISDFSIVKNELDATFADIRGKMIVMPHDSQMKFLLYSYL